MSLGGQNTTTQSIDPALKEAAMANLASAQRVGQLGFVPYTEATVAGMQPGQISAMQSTNLGAEAFGLPQTAIPTGGDLSPYQIYQTALSNMAPGQRAFIESMFINPMTGAAPTMQFGMQPAGGGAGGGGGGTGRASDEARQGSASSRNTKYDTYSTKADTTARAMSYGPQQKQGGYKSVKDAVKDVFDGGGLGASRKDAKKRK